MDTKKVGVITLAIAVVAMLVAAFAVTAYPGCDLLNASVYTGDNTLRVHGEDSFGPGDPSVVDPKTTNAVEDLPYTESIAPFDPQHIQAPPKDSITFNPLFLSHFNNSGEFDEDLLNAIVVENNDATEKVFWRQWYEPMHWDKDVDSNNLLTCVIRNGEDGICDTLKRGDDVQKIALNAFVPKDTILITPGPNGVLDSVPGDIDGDGVADRTCCMDDRISCDPDEAYPAIMQEFTYMLLEGKEWANKPEPIHGLPGAVSFVFPVGMREADLDSGCGYGLTSLDANFDETMDIVKVESELSLSTLTNIDADFNDNDEIDPLDNDGQPLTGDELAVFTISEKKLYVGDKLQFLDHMIEVISVQNSNHVVLDITYTGSTSLSDVGTRSVGEGEMLMVMKDSNQVIAAGGTNMNAAAMPWFAWVRTVDFSPANPNDRSARIMVGRALGHTHTGMEAEAGAHDDLGDGDPWFVKRFYVDGHEYNVVAIETFGNGDPYNGTTGDPCDDSAEFKYITIRTPIPKEGEYKNGVIVPSYYIAQHSVTLEVYDELEYLSVMPPFNHEHVMVGDVQSEWSDPVLFLGPLQFNTAGITQTAAGDHIWYIEELENPQFTGELLEKYNEGCSGEWWYAEQYNTMPNLYTEFVLPGGHGLYLLTSAFVAPSAQGQIVMQDEEYELIINGNRVKFWFDPADGTKIYKDTDGLRVYGEYNRGPGFIDPGVVVDVPYYTDPVAVFNPQQPESPRKDSITFDTAYMAEFIHTDEPLKDLYNDIMIEGVDAREKAYFRLWYEPEHWDKDANGNNKRETAECYPAVMEEFTYIYLGFDNLPSHGAPGSNTKFAFPIATNETDLWDPEGYGLNTFDCDFDLEEDIVKVHSETTLAGMTGISADFNGDGDITGLNPDDNPFNGDEYVIFVVESLYLEPGDRVMFLDHMIELDEVGSGWDVHLNWYATGGDNTDDFKPDLKSDVTSLILHREDMAILDETAGSVKMLSRDGADYDAENLGDHDGAWFVYVVSADDGINGGTDSVILHIGRALGEARHHIGNDLEDTPWYMKRFYVDGHEYNVVAVKTVATANSELVDEFKFITIRTPVPKEEFEIEQHSQYLEYYSPNGETITVMPPYNYEHTVRADVRPGWTAPYNSILPDLAGMGYMGPKENRPPLVINITAETKEPRFYGELKEMYNRRPEVIIGLESICEGPIPSEYVEYCGYGYYVGGLFAGIVDGRDVEGRFFGAIIRDDPAEGLCEGDGTIRGIWIAHEGDCGDEYLYNENEISEFWGIIDGTYDHSEGRITMEWRRDELTPNSGFEMQHDYLCFWAEFDFSAEVELYEGDCGYSNFLFPEHVFGGWDYLGVTPGEFEYCGDTYDVPELAGEDWEEWMTEQFWTRPDQYTEFELPTNHTYGDTTYDLYYLLTSSWYAPQAVWRTVNENNGGPHDITWYTGNRVKFWYNPATALDLFVNQDTPVNRDYITLVDQWDENGNGYMDLEEVVGAIMSYLTTGGTTPSMDDLIELLVDYLMNNP